MKRILIHFLSLFLLASLMVIVALKVPIPLATNSDFRVLYYTDQGLTRGINVYDHQGKIQMITEIRGGALDFDFIPQFAYPPWFALGTFFLGLFSIQSAATLWFEINLLMIFASIWFLTDGWAARYRLIAFPATFIFFPVLGTLAIGQYDFPVLLGLSMLIYSIKHKYPGLTALGMTFLTFKPHIGALILLAGLVHLLLRRDAFGRKALTYTLGAGIFLFVIGFLADSAWPVNYLNSLINYSGLSHITTCSECANLSVWLARSYNGGSGLSQASVISVILLVALVIALTLIRPPLWKFPALFLTYALLVTLLASPYLYNYDYVLLLVPFAILVISKNGMMDRIILALCYFIPLVFIGLFGRAGNVSLLVSTVMISILVYLQIKSLVDVPAFASYNTHN
jgi:hypothetical protein